MRKRYIVQLSAIEREFLGDLIENNRAAAERKRRARILLLVDEGEYGEGATDQEVADEIGCSRRNVEMIRERCVTLGLEAAIERQKRSRDRSRVLDGKGEARLVAIASSEPPEGYAKWTLSLLCGHLIELEIVETISTETVRQVLKKHNKTVATANVVYSA